MNPSLFSLFKRGRYYRSSFVRGGEESQRSTVEKERFITAAIAFCFLHDPAGFGAHFFKCVCQQDGDPDLNVNDFEIAFEDENFDLLIINRATANIAYVIEAKVGAGVQLNQDPSECTFWTDPGCYGAKMLRRFKGDEKVRYILLGKEINFSPVCVPKQIKHRWRFQQRLWSSVSKKAEEYPKSSISNDFAHLLSMLGIEAFMLRESQNLRPKLASSSVEIYMVVSDTCAVFGLSQKHWSLGVEKDANGSFFGVDISPPKGLGDKLGNQERLLRLIKPEGDHSILWFGYENETTKSVWFYCGTQEALRSVQEKLHAAKHRSKQHPGSTYVYVTMPKDFTDGHRDWFVSVLESAGMKKKKI